MATYRSLRCDAPNLRIPRPLLSAVHPERRPTNAPLKFTLHTVHLQRAPTVLLQHGSPTGSPTGSALRAHCGPRLSGKKRGGWYLRFCFIFAGARGAGSRGSTAHAEEQCRRKNSAAAPAGWAVALALRGCHRTFCSIRSPLSTVFSTVFSTSTRGEIVQRTAARGASRFLHFASPPLALCCAVLRCVPRTRPATCRYSRFALCFLWAWLHCVRPRINLQPRVLAVPTALCLHRFPNAFGGAQRAVRVGSYSTAPTFVFCPGSCALASCDIVFCHRPEFRRLEVYKGGAFLVLLPLVVGPFYIISSGIQQ